jgi:phage-related protein
MPKILKTLTKELPNLIKTYMEVLSTTYPIVIQAAIDLLGAIIDALPQIITAWQEAAPDLVMAIGEAIIDNIPLLWECVKQVWSTLFSAIPDLLLSLLEGLWAIITGALKAWARILTPVATWIYDNIISPVGDFFSDMWEGFKDKAAKAWEGVKSIFSKVAGFFGEKFGEAWQKVKDIFSTGGRVFDGIKEGIERAFTSTVNAIIRGINRVVSIPFTNINEVLDKLREVEILGLNPFENLIGNISIPQIPELAYGGILKRGQLGLLEGKNDEAVIPLQNNMEGMRRIAGILAAEMGGGKMGGDTVNNYTFTQTNNSPKALSRWDIYRQTKNLMNAMKGV